MNTVASGFFATESQIRNQPDFQNSSDFSSVGLGHHEMLTWHLAMVQAKSSSGSCHGLVVLQSWPDLTKIPADFVPSVTRLCALLWHKPTSSALLPRILQLETAEVFSLVKVMETMGHISVRSWTQGESAPPQGFEQTSILQNATSLTPSSAARNSREEKVSGMLSKLFARLVGK